ncbi:MAG: helix-turn-helix transcriptional regulator [Lachnospiraceae bacterium]|nr:helix-turn-helix transcriptional regulator [Lachnospiraceae bacterium]HBV84180.1 XRE family transcriptional regulator [Lachnospiraceae bacterium]
MHERLKQLRKTLDLTQQEFADRIGSKRNTIAKYETETNTPSAAVISLICREFRVNEKWLREGTGEMFLPIDRNADIAKLTRQLLDEETDSFKNRFISILANLDTHEWELLEKHARELYDGISVTETNKK